MGEQFALISRKQQVHAQIASVRRRVEAMRAKPPVNPDRNRCTVATRGRLARFLSWYSRRTEPLNPDRNRCTVATRGRLARFLSWYSRRTERDAGDQRRLHELESELEMLMAQEYQLRLRIDRSR